MSKRNIIYEDSSWDFRAEDTKTTSHGIHAYPAMMIPQIAKQLIKTYGAHSAILLDPFAGSGSSLVEAKLQGLNSYGIDINPVARLIAKVKSTLIEPKSIDHCVQTIKSKINESKLKQDFKTSMALMPTYTGLKFWFKEDVIKKLLKLKDIILQCSKNNRELKDFLMVTLSHTVRDCSNTRNGEFKLYKMPKEKMENYNPDVYKTFLTKLDYNGSALKAFYNECTKLPNYKDIWVNILNEDARKKTSIPTNSIDIIVTSPPYGDSRTTVAYGQYSRLSAEWLDLNNQKNNIDKISLGGLMVNSIDNHLDSKSLNLSLLRISKKDEKRAREVLSFYIDLDKCLAEIKRVMKPRGHICMVVGNRTVKGVQLPTDHILVEMSKKYGILHQKTIIRNIPNKRMPAKNSPTNIKGKLSSTMVKEYIVVLKVK